MRLKVEAGGMSSPAMLRVAMKRKAKRRVRVHLLSVPMWEEELVVGNSSLLARWALGLVLRTWR